MGALIGLTFVTAALPFSPEGTSGAQSSIPWNVQETRLPSVGTKTTVYSTAWWEFGLSATGTLWGNGTARDGGGILEFWLQNETNWLNNSSAVTLNGQVIPTQDIFSLDFPMGPGIWYLEAVEVYNPGPCFVNCSTVPVPSEVVWTSPLIITPIGTATLE